MAGDVKGVVSVFSVLEAFSVLLDYGSAAVLTFSPDVPAKRSGA